jgi:hypothetical protein
MKHDYRTICQDYLLFNLSERTKGVISKRFGFAGQRETLEAVGQAYGITRERVRQIENDGIVKLKEAAATPVCQRIFKDYTDYFKNNSGLKREDLLLAELGGDNFKNYVFFLLTISNDFIRITENEEFHSFWTTDKNLISKAQKAIETFVLKLEKQKQPMILPAFLPASYAEISKNILAGPKGLYGMKNWPEVNPKGIKDKAYIVLKEQEKPLHFTEVATLINSSLLFNSKKNVISQTVHNELIKDPRFVLVGRGLYGLKEWGYEPGFVRDVIYREIKGSRKPLPEKEIIKRVLNQRMVQPNTILLNLQNKKYFVKTPEGMYNIRRA